MQRKYFFKHLGSIIVYSVIGTAISILTTSALIYFIGWIGVATNLGLNGSFAFGALISATDPVAVMSIFKQMNCDKNLYALIFGESILNDAVSIIVYNITLQLKEEQGGYDTIWKALYDFLYVFFGSMVTGFVIGLLSAYRLKYKDKQNEETQNNTEMTILTIIPWVSYLVAEGLQLSGIVSIVFCGIAMVRYALPNVTENNQKVNKRLYNILAYTFENLVFIFIGVGFVCFDLAWKEMGVSLFVCAFLIINLARYINVETVSYFLNKYRTTNIVNKNFRFILWFSGFRGAMAYALSMKSREQFTQNNLGRIMLTITLLYSVINIFIHASILENIAKKCKIQQSFYNLEEQKDNLQVSDHNHQYQGFWNKVKEFFALVDQKYLQKFLLGNVDDMNLSLNINIEQLLRSLK
ncbi:sodium hydrogen, putative [Ichthyophthirius multifiliis]|uniref:Sodium hydrogen, putative n=1 Tax=Ichthyophthirius multifiliis TaxID=5932 RepID=G0QXI2_ICHMU|nr:sodium hydrogen, putative [Ichthyophthirius multifiliis]EGR30074.1 sodium hydrogen, putative [Ichthyophthirius multifiliis]|eukprot:XP_004031310.1 sodium hydrogen, putative [Ichthyophthirius multifiliis]